MLKKLPEAVCAVLSLASCLAAAPAFAGAAATVGSQAQVLESIQFAVLLDMDFGKVAVRDNVSGGDVVINPSSSGRSNFGAIIHINAGQAPGIYNGQFTVNLEYN